MPGTIVNADQHDKLRSGTYRAPPLVIDQLWRLDQVQPLFNVRSAVLFGERLADDEPHTRPVLIAGRTYSGTLGQRKNGRGAERNFSLDSVRSKLHVIETPFRLVRRGTRSYWGAETEAADTFVHSPYKDRFIEGAAIVPRALWFVRLRAGPIGFDEARPPLESDLLATAKKPWNQITLRAAVEAQFLFATLLAEDLLPFTHKTFRPVVLRLCRHHAPRATGTSSNAVSH